MLVYVSNPLILTFESIDSRRAVDVIAIPSDDISIEELIDEVRGFMCKHLSMWVMK